MTRWSCNTMPLPRRDIFYHTFPYLASECEARASIMMIYNTLLYHHISSYIIIMLARASHSLAGMESMEIYSISTRIYLLYQIPASGCEARASIMMIYNTLLYHHISSYIIIYHHNARSCFAKDDALRASSEIARRYGKYGDTRIST